MDFGNFRSLSSEFVETYAAMSASDADTSSQWSILEIGLSLSEAIADRAALHEGISSTQYIISREIGRKSPSLQYNKNRRIGALSRKCLKCHDLPQSFMRSTAKIFASAWLQDDLVLVGSKDNALKKVDVTTGEAIIIPLPNPPEPDLPRPPDNRGIHTISLSPYKDKFVTGGNNPADVVLFDAATCTPLRVMQGHTDWLFGSAWLDNETFATCGRDCAILFWNATDEGDNLYDMVHSA